MPPAYFPLRWESTGDQWWYVSPIDLAAANGLYDLVKELLYLDTNLLIKLTSLRRIRRLETVWDDEEQFEGVAKNRALVARKLLRECEVKGGHNSLIRAGYGGWLLYTAASAGDVSFVKALLERDPFLVYGEGEYGVTDIFYAAARSRNSEVFRLLLDISLSPGTKSCKGEEPEDQLAEIPSILKQELISRAVHASARGGNSKMLRELLGDCSDVLIHTDQQGFTVLHTACGRGQVEVVKDFLASFDIATVTDNQGNTGLHVAAYRGHISVVEILAQSCPPLTSMTNNNGDTFLHMAVAGFRTPGFRRLDRQVELMKQLVSGRIVDLRNIINVKNNHGRTALHVAVAENIQSALVELLMTVPCISLNIPDADGMTPLDLLRRQPRSASSEILIKQLISAGGIFSYYDHSKATRDAFVSHLKMQGIGSSPGTSFRIPDSEIFLYTGNENASREASVDPASDELSRCSSDLSQIDTSTGFKEVLTNKNSSNGNQTTRRLKIFLQWAKKKDTEPSATNLGLVENRLGSYNSAPSFKENPIPLRQRFSRLSSLSNHKRTFSDNSSFHPSPTTKKNFVASLMQGVFPQTASSQIGSPSSTLSKSSVSSPVSAANQTSHSGPLRFMSFNRGKTLGSKNKVPSSNKKLMNKYFCFGAQGLAVEDSSCATQPNEGYKRSSTLPVQRS